MEIIDSNADQTTGPNADQTTTGPNSDPTTGPNAAEETVEIEAGSTDDPANVTWENVQSFVLSFFTLFLCIIPIIVGIYTIIYVVVIEIAYIFNAFVQPLLGDFGNSLLEHCHVAFLYTFAAVALIAITVAMWRSTNYGIRIYIHQAGDE